MDFRWNTWNIEHLAEHGVSPDEAEYAIENASGPWPRKEADEKFRVWGRTEAGEYLQVIFVFDPSGSCLCNSCPALEQVGKVEIQTEPTMRLKKYTQMNLSELRAATKEYDKPWKGKGLPGNPLTLTERAQFETARRRGRPRVGAGAKMVAVTIERNLLKHADAAARKQGISRSELIARGLHAVLG